MISIDDLIAAAEPAPQAPYVFPLPGAPTIVIRRLADCPAFIDKILATEAKKTEADGPGPTLGYLAQQIEAAHEIAEHCVVSFTVEGEDRLGEVAAFLEGIATKSPRVFQPLWKIARATDPVPEAVSGNS